MMRRVTTTIDHQPLDAAALAAMAEPTRAAILVALSREELCTCHLVELTGARQTSVSNHLRVLRDAGLVEARPSGRYTYYRLAGEKVAALGQQLAAVAEASRTATVRRRPCD